MRDEIERLGAIGTAVETTARGVYASCQRSGRTFEVRRATEGEALAGLLAAVKFAVECEAIPG